ncbi:MAG: nuclear transport factor 2 family protein [Akkermansiaceae bacterium]|nr:nuclear transport factor 2 family protein [Akkermansiaceae bacterium]NNM31334.1 nuclear transport factor 2 family protein [Akkermansiaceae bacterium]
MTATPLDRIARYLESLRPESLDQLADHYAEGIDFRDPVNTGHGLDDLRTIFDDLFKQLQDVRIEVTRRAGDDAHGFLRWTMRYDFRGKPRELEGTSHFTFAPDGRAASQHDFWDAAFGVYAEFPLVGATLRGLRRLVRVKP